MRGGEQTTADDFIIFCVRICVFDKINSELYIYIHKKWLETRDTLRHGAVAKVLEV